ncbi:PucR family transcriptional regulator [Enterococcus aquimarinus]|uniref:PucR family transcriptional regulator n=1 Tax=Enterococcus aquimarinus TaxID=328396 RepID=A0A1L8QRK6_9ENTE|nr:PucR family transcriptional regulator [Enterococcus aquimarinus]OJG10109.1 hypothetical protein RU93_GL000359 [Enterococcus aquimarinus]
MKTLHDLLQQPAFADLTILTTEASLRVPIVNVDISETPDIASFIEPHSLLLTTGMAFKDDEEGLCQLMNSLKKLPCAGMAIKLNRYIPTLSTRVLDYANQLDFPILQIPDSLTLGQVSYKILSTILEDRTEELFFSMETQKKFANMLFKGATLPNLIEQLSQMVEQPILLLDPFGHLTSTNRFDSISSIETTNVKAEMMDTLLHHQQKRSKDSLTFTLSSAETVSVSVFPIQSEYYLPYLLIIFDNNPAPQNVSPFVIQQALVILALAINKEQALKNKQRLAQLNLFQQLLQTLPTNDLPELSSMLQANQSNYYRVALLQLLPNQSQTFYPSQIDEYVYELVEQVLAESNPTARVLPTDQPYHLALLFRNSLALRESLICIQEKLEHFINIKSALGVGEPVNQFSLCHFSYKEALSVLENHVVSPGIRFYDKQKSIHRIAENVSKEEMAYFCESILKELAYPTNPTDLELRRTLAAYLDSQCKIVETAEKMFLHRNTVHYRIKKCQNLFDAPIDSPELSLQLRVALYLSQPND